MKGKDAPEDGPTIQRISLGARLRALREAAGISREDAGYHIRGSAPKISRMELGRVGFKERDIIDLLAFYGNKDSKLESELLELARQANTQGWWHRYADHYANWFQNYLGLEAAASIIRTYELQFIPGLLQTADYARAVIRLGSKSLSAEQMEERVNLRMRRQQVLEREKPLRLWAVLDEAVLRRPVGAPEVMRAQIQALIEAADKPTVTMQVLPYAVGGHAATGGAFSILRFEDQQVSDIVYIEHLTSALYLDRDDDIDQYIEAMDNLSHQAYPPARTIATLQTILKEMTDGKG